MLYVITNRQEATIVETNGGSATYVMWGVYVLTEIKMFARPKTSVFIKLNKKVVDKTAS